MQNIKAAAYEYSKKQKELASKTDFYSPPLHQNLAEEYTVQTVNIEDPILHKVEEHAKKPLPPVFEKKTLDDSQRILSDLDSLLKDFDELPSDDPGTLATELTQTEERIEILQNEGGIPIPPPPPKPKLIQLLEKLRANIQNISNALRLQILLNFIKTHYRTILLALSLIVLTIIFHQTIFALAIYLYRYFIRPLLNSIYYLIKEGWGTPSARHLISQSISS